VNEISKALNIALIFTAACQSSSDVNTVNPDKLIAATAQARITHPIELTKEVALVPDGIKKALVSVEFDKLTSDKKLSMSGGGTWNVIEKSTIKRKLCLFGITVPHVIANISPSSHVGIWTSQGRTEMSDDYYFKNTDTIGYFAICVKNTPLIESVQGMGLSVFDTHIPAWDNSPLILAGFPNQFVHDTGDNPSLFISEGAISGPGLWWIRAPYTLAANGMSGSPGIKRDSGQIIGLVDSNNNSSTYLNRIPGTFTRLWFDFKREATDKLLTKLP
jgi:hypothetical protein